MAVLLVVARAGVPFPAAAPASSRSCQTSTSHPKAAAAPLLLPLPLLVPLLVALLLLPLLPPLLPAASNTRLRSRMG